MTMPTAQQVADYLAVPVTDEVTSAYAAEVNDQANRCRVDPYTDALGEALCRRVAHNLAMRGIPLGVQFDEAGGTRISSVDPEVRRLEAPYRKLSVG